MKSRNVAILSLPLDNNYGFVLQQWALYHVLEQNGFKPCILNRRWNRLKTNFVSKVKTFIYLHTICFPFYSFWKKMVHSPEIRTSNELRDYVSYGGYDTVIVGSDQVWRIEFTRGADLNYFFDFLDGVNVKKISYAPSFGVDEWNGSSDETMKIAQLLRKFDCLSVREQSGVSLCQRYFNMNVDCVLDPTLLLKESDYLKFIKKKRQKKGYVATYILDKSEVKNAFIKKIAGNMPIYPLYERRHKYSLYKSIEEWLTTIYYADFVVVDSFHGMVFSILFGKQFYVIANGRRGNSRFISLLKKLGLENRLVCDELEKSDVMKNKISYDEVFQRLDNLRENSYSFLLSALNN